MRRDHLDLDGAVLHLHLELLDALREDPQLLHLSLLQLVLYRRVHHYRELRLPVRDHYGGLSLLLGLYCDQIDAVCAEVLVFFVDPEEVAA